MAALRLLIHAPGAPGLRWFGLGPELRPSRGLGKLQRLFNKHAFWAQRRSFADLRRLLAGSTVVVDNKAGAGTVVGAQPVPQAAADGHTLLISSNTTWTMNPALKSKLPYDTLGSFESVGTLGGIPLVLLVHPSTPAKSVQELVALAKSQPGKLNYASFGIGSSSHFAGEMFKSAAGVDLTHVPYKGSAPAMQDLIGGQVPVSFDTNVATVPQVAAGKVRALAITSARRLATLPDVPTMAESGYPGFELTAWIAVVAPRGLPAPVRQQLTQSRGGTILFMHPPSRYREQPPGFIDNDDLAVLVDDFHILMAS